MQSIEIPSELKDVTLASYGFYSVQNPLEANFSVSEKLIKCCVLISKTNNMIELQNSKIKRIKQLEIGKALKVVVHHEFTPFQRFVVILTEGKEAHMFTFKDFKPINVWENIEDFSSADPSELGYPQLILQKTSGEKYTVTAKDFLIKQSSSKEESRKEEAVAALNNKVKMSLANAESLRAEINFKERFIAQKMSNLSNQLQLKMKTDTVKTSGGREESSSEASNILGSSFDPAPLSVLSSRQRIIHNKWVICVNIINQSDRYLIQNLKLFLYVVKGLKNLRYKTRLLRSYCKPTVKKDTPHPSTQPSDVNIVDLEPPILRPKKKAYMLAICDFPEFPSDGSIATNGIILFEKRSMKAETEERVAKGQITFPTIELLAKNLNSVCVDISREHLGKGLSFEIFAVIAASVCHRLILNSAASPLDQVAEMFLKDPRIVKMPHLTEFYCFNTPECPPLHLASFMWKSKSANKLSFTTYTRDDNQAMILIHTLRESLPSDVYFTCEETHSTSMSESSMRDLLAKMQLTVSRITDIFEKDDTKRDNKKSKSSDATKSSKQLRTECDEREYLAWRRDLHRLSLEMETLMRDPSDLF